MDREHPMWIEADLQVHDVGAHVGLLAVSIDSVASREPLGSMETNSNYILDEVDVVNFKDGKAEIACEKSASKTSAESIGLHFLCTMLSRHGRFWW